MRARAWAWLPALALAGCAVGPDYRRPETAAPEGWLALAQPLAEGQRLVAAEASAWWKTFGDPLLDGLLGRALQDNLDLKAAAARVEEARAARRSSRAALFPSVDGTLGASDNRNTQPVFLKGLGYELYDIGFDAAWEVDLFGRLRRQLEAASADLDAARDERRAVAVTLAAEVARDYVEYRSLQNQLRITHANRETQERTLALTERQFAGGIGTRHDVVRARAQVEATRAEVPLLEQGLFAAQRRLEVLLGAQPGALAAELEPVGAVPVAREARVLAMPAEAIRRRPDLAAAERRLAAATALRGAAIAELYPKVSLEAFLGLKSADVATLFNPVSKSWTAGANLLAPLIDFGRIRAGIRMAEARQQQAYLRYEQSVLQALAETETALNRYLQQEKHRAALALSVADLQQAAALSRRRYQEGVASFLEVLDAERAQFGAQIGLARAEADVSTGLIAVYKALGGDGGPAEDAGG